MTDQVDNTNSRTVPTPHAVALRFNDTTIRDRGEMLSLTDMWKAAGSPDDKRPSQWARYQGAEFIAFLADAENVRSEHILAAARGRAGATFGHWQIALAYAKHLSPEFHMWCNTVVRERMEGKPTHSLEVATFDNEARKVLGGIVKGIVGSQLAEAINTLLPTLIREAIGAGHYGVVKGLSAGEVLDLAAVGTMKGLPNFTSRRLLNYHLERGIAPSLTSAGKNKVKLFDPTLSREWLASGGKAILERKIAERRGQGVLKLVHKNT